MEKKMLKGGVLLILMVFFGLIQAPELAAQTGTTTKPKTTQSKTTTVQKKATTPQKKPAQPASKPQTVKKAPPEGTIRIGSQTWASVNLNVATFRNGDTIPEAKSNEEWVAAAQSGSPACCYYNNDPKNGAKYGKLYNWFAMNDPRGLAPAGWSLPDASDWSQLAVYLGGPDVAGNKLKSSSGWNEGYNGSNDSGFNGLPGGYRVENGNFLNFGSIGTWWSTTEGKSGTAIDHYLGQRGSLGRSNNNRQRGESVRCIKKQE